MEMVFRKIEYALESDAAEQRALASAPWSRRKLIRRIAKHTMSSPSSYPGTDARVSRGPHSTYRPSDVHLDHHLRLAADANGSQRIDARKLRPGLWKVRVQWTVEGREYFFDQPVIVGAHVS